MRFVLLWAVKIILTYFVSLHLGHLYLRNFYSTFYTVSTKDVRNREFEKFLLINYITSSNAYRFALKVFKVMLHL